MVPIVQMLLCLDCVGVMGGWLGRALSARYKAYIPCRAHDQRKLDVDLQA